LGQDEPVGENGFWLLTQNADAEVVVAEKGQAVAGAIVWDGRGTSGEAGADTGFEIWVASEADVGV
jgi:hypothetical protein